MNAHSGKIRTERRLHLVTYRGRKRASSEGDVIREAREALSPPPLVPAAEEVEREADDGMDERGPTQLPALTATAARSASCSYTSPGLLIVSFVCSSGSLISSCSTCREFTCTFGCIPAHAEDVDRYPTEIVTESDSIGSIQVCRCRSLRWLLAAAV